MRLNKAHYNSKATVRFVYINFEVDMFYKDLCKLWNETLRLTDNYGY